MKKFSHWVFDLDGTVIDSSKYYELSVQTILSELGITPTADDMIRAYKYFNPDEYFATFPIEPSQVKQAVQRLVSLNQEHADKIPAFKGIEELFSYLTSQGVHVSVWTGRELPSAQKILKSTGLAKHLKTCVGRTCVQNNKPFPDGLVKIIQDFGHHVDDVVMVGDHEYDIQGALAAKVNSISVNWEGKAHPEARALSNLHFDSVQELHSWAKSLYA